MYRDVRHIRSPAPINRLQRSLFEKLPLAYRETHSTSQHLTHSHHNTALTSLLNRQHHTGWLQMMWVIT